MVKHLLPRWMQRRWKAVRRGRASSSERGPVDMLAVPGALRGTAAGGSPGEWPWGWDVESLNEQGEIRAGHLPDSQEAMGGERQWSGMGAYHDVTYRLLEQHDACEVLRDRSHRVSQQPHYRCLPCRHENLCPCKNLRTKYHSSFIC